MIALPTAMPFIRIGDASLTVCQTEWLTKTLTDAAVGTNLPAWLAEDISRGVENYLSNHFEGSVIDSADLFEQIGTTLARLGLGDVADNMDKTPPPLRISLTELARRAGEGYELAFFRLLDEQFQSAASGGAKRVECHGLQKCVRKLSSARKWSRRCDRLQREIERFLDCKIQQISAGCSPLTISISQ